MTDETGRQGVDIVSGVAAWPARDQFQLERLCLGKQPMPITSIDARSCKNEKTASPTSHPPYSFVHASSSRPNNDLGEGGEKFGGHPMPSLPSPSSRGAILFTRAQAGRIKETTPGTG
jgi:hypothetical protein